MMHSAYNILIFIHVTFGFVSLVLFWIPIISKKGSAVHIRAGYYYSKIMYTVATSAIILAILILIDPIATKYPGHRFEPSELLNIIAEIRSISFFLLAISFLVLANVRHGLLTIKYKKQHSKMREPSHLLLNLILVSMGVSLIFLASGNNAILFYVFAALCIVLGGGNLRYCLRKEAPKMEWLIAHLGSMIGAGIGSYTAFFVFGGSRYLSEILTGQWQLIPWILPGILGGLSISYLTRKYRRKSA